MSLLTEDETQGHQSWRQAAALPHRHLPTHKSLFSSFGVQLPPAWVYRRRQQRRENRRRRSHYNQFAQLVRADRLRVDWILLRGWGAGPAGGRGAFREAGAFCLPRMGPIRAAGWRHCCGGSHPAQVPSQSKMGGALVSLTPEAPRLIAHGANTPQSAAASSITGY